MINDPRQGKEAVANKSGGALPRGIPLCVSRASDMFPPCLPDY